MGIAIHCAYCLKPLVDADHARAHVVNQCEKSPTKVLADALEGLVREVRKVGYSGSVPLIVVEAEKAEAALRAVGRIKN